MALKQIDERLPSSLIRLGIFIAIFCIGIFFFISWLLEYKDTIDGRIVLTTPTLPVDIHANVTGKLLLLTANNTLVQKGDHLAYIENSAQLDPSLTLLKCLDSVLMVNPFPKQAPSFLSDLRAAELGEIQPAFINLQKAYTAYSFFLKTDKHQALIQQKKDQVQFHQEHIVLSKDKIQLHQQNLANAKKQLAVDQQLYAENIIAKRTLDQAQQTYDELKFTGRLIDFQTAISNANIQIAQQEEAIIQLKNNFIIEKERLENQIADAYQFLKKEIHDWQEQYLSIADMEGQVIYSETLSDFNYIRKDNKIMTLLPQEKEQIIGLLQVPLNGYSKVEIGQPVQVRLDNYPFQEFGIIHGEVAERSSIPEEEGYTVTVFFPKGLRSSYNLDFKFNQRMEGEAAIITNRISIWQRLQNQMNSTRLNN